MIFKGWIRPRFRNFKLSSKLIITYILLTALPMALLGYISYLQYAKSVEKQIGEYMPKFLYQANADIEKQIQELSILPDLLFNSDTVLGALRRNDSPNRSAANRDNYLVNSYLNRTFLSGSYPDVLGVYVLSKDRLFYNAKLTFSQSDWMEKMRQLGKEETLRGQVKIILPEESGLNFPGGTPYILIKKEIQDVDNRRVIGSMLIAVDISFMGNIFRNFETNEKADMWVMDPSGRIIYHTDQNRIGEVDAHKADYPLLNGSFRTSGSSQSTLMSVNESPMLGWVSVHRIPLSELTGHTDLVRNVTAFVFLLIILVTTVISIFLSLNITRPLKKLGGLMKHVEMGNFNVDLKVQSGDDIGVLARSFNSMIATTRELIQKNYQFEIRQKEAELYALQSQINPHFMYNTLETISMAVEEGETDTVVSMVTLLGRMLRFSVSNITKSVTIAEEVQHVRDYLTIQKFRFEDRLTFNIVDHLEEDTADQLYTPKFILQPVVENAIKHGLETRKLFTIEISVRQEFSARSGMKDIVFRIRDNGPGISSEKLALLETSLRSRSLTPRSSQFGLSNVNARIVMMHGEFYGLEIHSMEGIGTEVTVRIPKNLSTQVSVAEKG